MLVDLYSSVDGSAAAALSLSPFPLSFICWSRVCGTCIGCLVYLQNTQLAHSISTVHQSWPALRPLNTADREPGWRVDAAHMYRLQVLSKQLAPEGADGSLTLQPASSAQQVLVRRLRAHKAESAAQFAVTQACSSTSVLAGRGRCRRACMSNDRLAFRMHAGCGRHRV